ncbi:hypothetical protein FB45DRAFT_835229 [Roridomyces roridus]|uniref:protein disulfide-isomerase n=1 Tax=Roridomyces roridus TaxID=1738132 RepID=A0AAD7BPG9_9AGAR|nr:hypothetical protein FB45DRAFT_835229 [Roridomyces roridus]
MHLIRSFLALSFLLVSRLLQANAAAAATRPKPVRLAAFYEGGTGLEKAFLSQLDEAAPALRMYNIDITRIDCTIEQAQCQRSRPGPMPFLRVYQWGIPQQYRGKSNQADDIVSYMLRKYTDAIARVSALDLDEFKSSEKIVAIAFLTSSFGRAATAFRAVKAKYHEEILFGLSTDPEAAAAAQVKVSSIVVYRQFDEPRVVYPYPLHGASTADRFEEWLLELSLPLFGEFNELNAGMYFNYLRATGNWTTPMANLILDPTDERTPALVSSMTLLAEAYRPAMVFSWSDSRTTTPKQYRYYGLAGKAEPAPSFFFFIEDIRSSRFFPYDQSQPVDAAGVAEFIKQYLDGQLVPVPKTLPILEHQTGNVYELVRAEFDEVVLDDSKDVFVEFYSGSPGRLPTGALARLGDRYAALKDTLTIARMSVEYNDLPPYVGEISQTPTIKLKPAGGHGFIDYHGDAESFEGLVEFLEEHAVNGLEGGIGAGRSGQVPLRGRVDSESDSVA